jgi:hypothetical protein
LAKQKRPARPTAPRDEKAALRSTTRASSARTQSFWSSLLLPDGKVTGRGYVVMNVLFDVFCILQLFFIRFTLHETRGLYFFFGLLMLGFFVVSIYDYAYDRLVPSTPETE